MLSGQGWQAPAEVEEQETVQWLDLLRRRGWETTSSHCPARAAPAAAAAKAEPEKKGLRLRPVLERATVLERVTVLEDPAGRHPAI
mmetsp:Transcript_17361/g.35863  ORF Transcript_17361/g.35863 Transcript_17361/m.35863 type:complete len:86 (-) Transcript_17361:112-369(-)